MVAYPTPPNLYVRRELGPGREQSFPTSLPTPLTTTSGRRCSTSSTTSALSLTFSLSRGISVKRCITKRQQNFTRKAKDTDYLLITEDMKTYGCGCCSIGLGKSNLGDYRTTNFVSEDKKKSYKVTKVTVTNLLGPCRRRTDWGFKIFPNLKFANLSF